MKRHAPRRRPPRVRFDDPPPADARLPAYLREVKWQTDWVDEEEDYRVNEIAINWNAPLVYALAGFLGPPP